MKGRWFVAVAALVLADAAEATTLAVLYGSMESRLCAVFVRGSPR